MKHNTILSTLAGLCLLTLSTVANAQQTGSLDVPTTISYQGLLTSNDGASLPDGMYQVTVTLYGDEAGKQILWQENHNATLSNGIFNLYLGSNTPLPSSQQLNRPLWVGTSINGADEMRPLTPLTASPYALNLPDNAVTTDKLADGAVTAEKVEMDYISGIMVNGEKISGNGSVLDIRSSGDIAVSYDKESRTLEIGRQHQTGTTDSEKDAGALGSGTDSWAMEGDGVDAGGIAVASDANDWIGTKGNFNFTIKVNNNGAAAGGNQRVMQYLPNGTSANILGGHNSNSIGNGVGNVIAGGGLSGSANSIADNNYSVISGGRNNLIDADAATIGGGGSNEVTAVGGTVGGGGSNIVSAQYAVVAGGIDNTISVEFSTIGGGWNNDISGIASVIGGGDDNIVQSGLSGILAGGDNQILADFSVIGGGSANSISDAGSIYSIIVGGADNVINSAAEYSMIGGGTENEIISQMSFIANGDRNNIEGLYGVIGSGLQNSIVNGLSSELASQSAFIGTGIFNEIHAGYGFIGTGGFNFIHETASFSAIVGGQYHEIEEDHSFIGNGYGSLVANGFSGIVSGFSNQISGGSASVPSGADFIGGGMENLVHGRFSSVVGGRDQRVGNHIPLEEVQSNYSFIGGGSSNIVRTDYSAITGGDQNQIVVSGNYSFVGGGQSNVMTNGEWGVITGGQGNIIGSAIDPASNAIVGGGERNFIYADHGTIAGGKNNLIEDGISAAFIGGGTENRIAASTASDVSSSVITGGRFNLINADAGLSSIGGGSGNTIAAEPSITNPNFLHATIPGGDNLTAQSWAQTVIGGYNFPKGSMSARGVFGGDRNDPVLIIGAGYYDATPDAMVSFNAFEVSYNGHSVVYDENGTGGATGTGRPAIRGATYTDNVVYAWAYAIPDVLDVDVQCDFGVASVQKMGTGHYKVNMNHVNPEEEADGTFCPTSIECGSVTANIVHEGRMCAFINTTPITGNSFQIFISDRQCEAIDLPFTFKVTGRLAACP